MPIKGAVINEGATVSSTGGTPVTYSNTASSGVGVLTINTSESDARIRPTSLFHVKQPVYDSRAKTYTKGKLAITHRRPFDDADEGMIFPQMRVELELHPAMTPAQIQAFWDWLAQVAIDSDYANFRSYGSLD